jgi:fibronectin-binding autotransporter adhesin
MKRFGGIAVYAAMFIALGAWRINVPSGDIQPWGGSGNSNSANSNTANFATTAGSANNANNVVAGGNVTTNAVNANKLCNNAASNYCLTFADAVHITLNANGLAALSFDGSQNAVFGGNITLPSADYVAWLSRVRLLSTVDGTLQITTSTGTFGTLLLGATGAATGIQMVSSANALTLLGGDGSTPSNLTLSAPRLQGNNLVASPLFRVTALGTAAAPSITNTVGTSISGVYWPTATTVGLSSNGVAALTFDANQQATFNGNIILNAGGLMQETNVTGAPGTVQGMRFSDTALLLGGSGTAGAGVVLQLFGGGLAVSNGVGGYSTGTFGGLVSHGAYQVSGSGVATGNIYQLTSAGGLGNVDANHTTIYSYNGSAATPAVNFDLGQNANFGGNVTIPASDYYAWSGNTQLLSPTNGTLQVASSTGAFGSLLLGATGSATGIKLVSTNATLTLSGGDGTNLYGTSFSTGNFTIPGIGSLINSSSSLILTAGSGGNAGKITFPNVSTGTVAFAQATGTLTGPGFSFNGAVAFPGATHDTAGVLAPSQINQESVYFADEFMGSVSTGSYTVSGNTDNNINHTISILSPSTQGVLQTWTSSATQGGGVSSGSEVVVVKSSAITYQWRSLFYLPTASTSTNRYIAYIGAIQANTATSTYAPFGGAYIKYSDNVNSGNWVLGSAVSATLTTTNSVVAATTGWHKLTITLVNGTFTYVLDGVTLGTVTDTNILTTVASGAFAQGFGAVMVPDGTNWTAIQYLTVDRADLYVTGLSR